MISQATAARLEHYNKARSQLSTDLPDAVHALIAAADRLAESVEDDE